MADTASAPTSDDQLREEVAAWLAANWDPSMRARMRVEGGYGGEPGPYSAWLAKVVEARWAVPRWQTAWFGRGLKDDQARIIEREFARVGAPGAGQDRTNLWANTLLARGTEALKAKLVGPLLRNEVGMCLLYSEPGAGSDLAGVRTRAERRGDHFVVNGQKVWTSSAAAADYGMLIARTDWDAPKHSGISFLFCPMKQSGVEVRPLRQITNESHFNEVFLTDVIIPEENLLGDLNGGWGVLQTALAYERSVMGEGARGPRSGVAEAKNEEPLIALAREAGALGDPLIRQDIAQVIAYKTLNALNTARAKTDLAVGTSSPVMSLGSSPCPGSCTRRRGCAPPSWARAVCSKAPITPVRRTPTSSPSTPTSPPSAAAPTRSSATSSANGSWACPRSLKSTVTSPFGRCGQARA
jgi:alkylation response protein AidB-like acyl-CoA dehydrogenase